MADVSETKWAAARAAALLVSRPDPPVWQITIWPNRSLGSTGVTWLFAIATLGLTMPLLPVLGTRIAWVLLPFLIMPLVLLYCFLRLSYRDGRLSETLRLWPDLITVTRRNPNGSEQFWNAHPFWVKLKIHPDGRPENYLTLKGNGREIELGAFLSPEERVCLHHTIETAINRLK